MGSQWLYISFLNIISLAIILWNWKTFYAAADRIGRSLFTLLYFAFFLVAGISILFAINQSESLINYSRLANTLTAYLVVSTLLFNRLHLFRIIAILVSVFLFFECARILIEFFNKLGDTDIVQLILNLRGNA